MTPSPTNQPTRKVPCTFPTAYEPLIVVTSAFHIRPPIFPPTAPLALILAELEEFCTIVPFCAFHMSPHIFESNPATVPFACTPFRVVLFAYPTTAQTSPSSSKNWLNVLTTDHDTVRLDIVAPLVALKSPT